MMPRTVVFEKKYNTNIKNFSTTEQVTSFLEGKLDKRLKTVSLHKSVVSTRGNIFPIRRGDIDQEFDSALKVSKKPNWIK